MKEDNIMYGYIYETINLINNKKYIGQHKCSQFDPNYKGSGKRLRQAFKKYGKENFSCTLLKKCFSKKELDEQEKYFIEIYNCVESRDYYNIKPGGEGGNGSGLVYIRKGITYKRVLPEELQEYFDQGFELGGYIPPNEERINRANAHVGLKYKHSENFLKNGSKLKGRKLPKETLIKISNSCKGRESPTKGTIAVTDELKVVHILPDQLEYYESLGYRKGMPKRTEQQRKNYSKGKSGTKCIHKDKTIKYINPDLVQQYLNEGWSLGTGKKKIN